MPIAGRQLASGQLPNANAALYTAPALTTTYVSSIILFNTDGVNTHSCTLRVNPVGAPPARIVGYVELGPHYTTHITSSEKIILDTGDVLEGDDGGAGGAVIDYTVNGGEQT